MKIVDLPFLVHNNSRCFESITAVSTTQLDMVVQRLPNDSDACWCPLVLESNSNNMPMIEHEMSELRSYITSNADSSHLTLTKCQENNQRFACTPTCVQYDGLFQRQFVSTLENVSHQVFKSVVRKNAAHLLPKVMSDHAPIEKLLEQLLRPKGAMDNLFASECEGDGLRQLVLPFEVTCEDANRLEAVCETVANHAHHVLRTLRHLSSSVLTASISVPSVWRCDAAKALVCRYAEETRPASGIDEAGVSHRTCLTVEAEKNFFESTVPQSSALSSELSQREQVCKKVRFKGDNNRQISTDELVNLYIKPQEISPASTESREPRPRESHVNELIEKLARPVIWDLMRQKLLRIESSTLANALATISPETMKAIVFQLHTKLKGIRMNPSMTTHDEIEQLCLSFRNAMFLHLLM